MVYWPRTLKAHLDHALKRGKSVLLLGPRQTGKTTLLKQLQTDLMLSFVDVTVRLEHEKNPSLLKGEVEALKEKKRPKTPLVLIDEVQKVPIILDVVQDLIDRKQAQFVLSGSSARKLRRSSSINLLPGRVVSLRLDPLTFQEKPDETLKNRILYGALPGISQTRNLKDKDTDLASYVTTYLEEEVRAESIVRNLGTFARFLELAASESGYIVNFKKLSQEIGVADTTITSYYEILEDCLIAERVDPLTKSKTRKKLTKASKYLFFDLGVRRLAAQEGTKLPREAIGHLLEQWVGLELIRSARLTQGKTKILFWRDLNGPEVDWVIHKEGALIPIEVKWTTSPRYSHIKHLKMFLKDYPEAKKGYVVCQVSREVKLDNQIWAIPWKKTSTLLA